MGAYSPAPIMTADMSARVMREIIEPTLVGMKARGAPYKGVLFAGLMLTKDGPKLIEFNARFGDPETQVMLPRLQEDLLPLLMQCAKGNLRSEPVKLQAKTAMTVVYAATGYPENPQKGSVIRHLEKAEAMDNVIVFHAGTKRDGDKLIANGGRVLNITGLGESVREARDRAYAGLDLIEWPEGFCRRDIGWRALK
jgi:phosphoribosylamine--glycine ligase